VGQNVETLNKKGLQSAMLSKSIGRSACDVHFEGILAGIPLKTHPKHIKNDTF
jgi:hypothetical protein